MIFAGGYHLHVGGHYLYHTAAVLHMGIDRPAGREVAVVWLHHGACVDPAAWRCVLVRLLLRLSGVDKRLMFCRTHGRKPITISICLRLCQPDDMQTLSRHNMQLLKADQSVLCLSNRQLMCWHPI